METAPCGLPSLPWEGVFLLDLFECKCNGLQPRLVAGTAIVDRGDDRILQLNLQEVDGIRAALAFRDEHFGHHFVIHAELEEDRRGLINLLGHAEIVNGRLTAAQPTAAGRYRMRWPERIGQDGDLFLVPVVGGLPLTSVDLDPHAPAMSSLLSSLDCLLRGHATQHVLTGRPLPMAPTRWTRPTRRTTARLRYRDGHSVIGADSTRQTAKGVHATGSSLEETGGGNSALPSAAAGSHRALPGLSV